MIINIGNKVKVSCGFFKKKIKEGVVEDIKIWEGYDSNIEHIIIKLNNGKKVKSVTQNGKSFINRYKILEVLD